ncbi:MAG TPA: cupredoxin domain-containing protein [Gemmatimonadaceae bacterium]|nr:cupredoxin domain-containing protein [Gemmatimonadaceae bacterium]
MTPIEWAVLIGGIAAIGWVVWYFFFAEARSASAVDRGSGVQEIVIAVHGGYDPSTIHVKRGRRVRLIFDRQERDSCSEEVVIGALGVRRYLPAFERTAVELTLDEPGRYDFTCGMGMLHGALVVE